MEPTVYVMRKITTHLIYCKKIKKHTEPILCIQAREIYIKVTVYINT